jgi:hypothetical protein
MMLKVGWYFIAFVLCSALSGCPGGGSSSASQSPTSSTSTTLQPAPIQERTSYFNSQFTLRNDGSETAVFTLKVNNSGPYEDLVDLKNAIIAYQDEYPDEPLYRKAWRFVMDQNTHFIPLDGSTSQDNPLLYLNSPGFGFCSDVATALSYIWNLLGYPSRIWELNGHVVPSVYADGAWHMLDPDLKVYYLDSHGLVASVPELETDTSLITSPLQVLVEASPTAYSETVAEIYASSSDNFTYLVPTPEQDFNLSWILPHGSSLTMPLPVTEIQTTQGVLAGSDANAHIAVLAIPAGSQGEVDIPLIVQDIIGSGQVVVTDSSGSTITFEIGSDALEKFINARTALSGANYFYRLHISAITPVKISYFINSKTMSLGAENLLDIKGSNISDVSIN